MTESSGAPQPPPTPTGVSAEILAAMPKLWIGFALSAASFLGTAIAVTRHPEVFKGSGIVVPPLEMFLPVFITRVYWFVCVYRIHKVLALVPGYTHPISPAKAVGFHFIPIFQFYWVFHWSIATAKFINDRVGTPLIRGWIVGLGILFALLWSIVEPVTGSLLLFTVTGYLAAFLKRALTVNATPPARQEGS